MADRVTDRLGLRLGATLFAWSLMLVSVGLLAAALTILLAPWVGSAVAMTVVACLMAATGGGLLLLLRRSRGERLHQRR